MSDTDLVDSTSPKGLARLDLGTDLREADEDDVAELILGDSR